MRKIAIIGAASGQLPLCLKAKEMGLETYCFAWPENAVCRDHVDHFIPISIMEMDEIVDRCKDAGVDGVVTNASEVTAAVANYVAEKLGLPCTPYATFLKIQDKDYVRSATSEIKGLGKVRLTKGRPSDIVKTMPRPFVLKPVKGSAKKGVLFVDEDTVIPQDVLDSQEQYLGEEYIPGQEYSIETLSSNGKHQIIQITEKDSSGPPHFVELGHHQPGRISQLAQDNVIALIPQILSSIGYENGAAHIEIKVKGDEVFLIEVNPRGGGDFISNTLVGLSTDFDYLRGIIEVAMGTYVQSTPHNTSFAGIYFLTAQTSRLLPYFTGGRNDEWVYEKQLFSDALQESKSNYDHNGYLIYRCDHKIEL